MKGWICDHCHAQIKQEKEPEVCPLCQKRNTGFDETELPEPTELDKEYTKKYEDIIKKLEEYEEGCEPRTMQCSFDD